MDVVQEAISRLSNVAREETRLLEQLQALFHDRYQDEGLSEALAVLMASGHLERLLGSEAWGVAVDSVGAFGSLVNTPGTRIIQKHPSCS